jgi:hypothetical protein
VTRRESGKLLSAPSSKLGVELIANTNRIVPAVGGEARDKRKRVTFADAFAAHVEPVAAVAAQLGVDVGPLAVQHSEPVVVQQHGRLRLDVTPAHRQLRPRTAAQSGSASSFSNTHCSDTRQQWRPTRRAHIAWSNCFTVSCRGSV